MKRVHVVGSPVPPSQGVIVECNKIHGNSFWSCPYSLHHVLLTEGEYLIMRGAAPVEIEPLRDDAVIQEVRDSVREVALNLYAVDRRQASLADRVRVLEGLAEKLWP